MEVEGVVLQPDSPSVVPIRRIYHWSRYSVGASNRGNYRYGAIKPPTHAHGWFPAAISPTAVLVACTRTFASPEDAVDWLRSAGQGR